MSPGADTMRSGGGRKNKKEVNRFIKYEKQMKNMQESE
jgi:hypothetical protein